MGNKTTWLHVLGAGALAIGASAATLGGTLAVLPHSNGTCQAGRETDTTGAHSADETHRLVA